MHTNQPLLQRIDAYLNAVPRKSCDVETIGPCTCFFRRDSSMPEVSYARPTGVLTEDWDAEIARVREAFARRNRVCRWEFLVDLFPDLPAILVAKGFPEPIPRPLMVVTPETFRPEISDYAEIRSIGVGETAPISRVLEAAFGEKDFEPDANTGEGEDLLGGMVQNGTVVYGAFVEGRPVGGGAHSPVGETTEVAGVGTLRAYRRRGIAGAITSALVADAFAQGCVCVFLSAADASVQRVYERIGFERVGVAMDTMDAMVP